MASQPLAQSTHDGNDAAAANVAVEAARDAKRLKKAHCVLTSDSGAAAPCPEDDLAVSQSNPQPHATLDPNDYQDRPHDPLAASLSCALCHGLLQEAMTSPECGHTYCYDCIEGRVEVGGNHNVCPVAGCGSVLGPNPFHHHRLMYDTLLDSLVQKIFPRPELDAALATRRAEREAATRVARAQINGASGRGHPQHHHQQQQQTRAAAKSRMSSPGGGAGRGRGVRGLSSPDGGEEGDDEGSDLEPSSRRAHCHSTAPETATTIAAAGGPRRHR